MTGASQAVVVGDWPLVHTAQILAAEDAGADAAAQMGSVLDRLDRVLDEAQSGLERIVKLNIYIARDELAAEATKVLSERLRGPHKPAVSWVVTALPYDRAVVAADAVATSAAPPANALQRFGEGGASATLCPSGTRIYVAGQAERADTLAEATTKTLESLRGTLKFLGRRDADIVQLKAFVMPMSDAKVVERAVAEVFGDAAPPLVLVEWKSSAAVPVEIEMIAWGGKNNAGEAVEYLTPPGMTASPIYSRVARINHTQTIYTSGLYGTPGDDPNTPAAGEREVKEVFASLDRILKKSGSDFRHLVKATYYVATDAASAKLNELRPQYYDPQRPPAASKAAVQGTGRKLLGLTIDMIAVPASGEDNPEYGPTEHGYHLTPEDAAAGWISLFDGETDFGWDGATVKDGVLSGGATTTKFGPIELRATFARDGAIFIGGREMPVKEGPFELEDHSADVKQPAEIRLSAGTAITHLAVRPLGLKPLFNGRDLTGWKRIDHVHVPEEKRPTWGVNDGAIRAVGGPGCVEYQDGMFGDFVLQLDVRARVRHANGGVFFRAIPGDFMNGYEAQVFSRGEDSDPARPAVWSTGALDDRQNARRVVSRDGQFFRMTIIARGPHIATWVNGFQQTDFTDERLPHENARQGLRVEPGVIQLQAHDPGTDIEFKNIAAGT
jgi:enamine deaminase RidA (YjgF/YER057c/UK114 family)